MSDISKQAKVGASWIAISQLFQPAWEFLVGIILARWLSPQDFGVVAMGTIFFALATSISNLGIGNVLVQKEELRPVDITTSQAISALAGALVYLCLFSASFFATDFFNEPLAGKVLRVFGIILLINSVTMVPSALLTRKMQLRQNAYINISGSLVYGVSALLLARLDFHLWSLVYAPVISVTFRCLCTCAAARYLPRFGWSREAARHIVRFGGGLTVSSLLNFAARNLDFLIIGRFLGSADLGLYKRAYDLAVIPKEKVADSLGSVLLPFLCKIRNDRAWAKSAFLKCNRTVALICIPLLFFFMASASTIVAVLYGQKWLPSVQPLRIMSLGGVFYAIFAPVGAVLVAYQRSKAFFVLELTYSSLLLAATLIGVKYGITGVAVGVVVSLFAVMCLSVYMLIDTISVTAAEFAKSMSTPFIIGGTVLALELVLDSILKGQSEIVGLVVRFNVMLLTCLGFLLCSKDSLLIEFRNSIATKLSGMNFLSRKVK